MSIQNLISPNDYSQLLNPAFNNVLIYEDLTVDGDVIVNGSITFTMLTIQNDNNNIFPNQFIIEGLTDPLQQLDIGYDTTNDLGSIIAQNNGVIKPLQLNINFNGSNLGDVNLGNCFTDTISGYTSVNTLNLGSFHLTTNRISPQVDGSITIKSTGSGYSTTIEKINILNEIISTTILNDDLTLATTGTGRILLNDIVFDGDIIKANTTNANLSILKNGSGKVLIEDVSFSVDTIKANTTNASLSILKNGTGKVLVEDVSFTVDTIKANTTNATLSILKNGSGTVAIEDIHFLDDTISSTSNQNINIIPNGSGNVVLATNITSVIASDLTIMTNTISSNTANEDININPNGSGNVCIGGAASIYKLNVNGEIDISSGSSYNINHSPIINRTNIYQKGSSNGTLTLANNLVSSARSQNFQDRSGTISLVPNAFISSSYPSGITVVSGGGVDVVVDQVLFAGANFMNIKAALGIQMIYSSTTSTSTTVKINDFTNSLPMGALIAPSTNGAKVILDLGTILNIPVNAAILQLTFDPSGGTNAVYYGMLISGN